MSLLLEYGNSNLRRGFPPVRRPYGIGLGPTIQPPQSKILRLLSLHLPQKNFLHWLISQSMFIARTEILDTYGQPEPISYLEVGFSPLAIFLALLFGSGMVLAMISNGFRKLKPGGLVGNNSLAIAATCQTPEEDVDAQLKRV